MKNFFLSVWQYIKINKKKEFIPLLSLLENKEFSEILKMFRERFYICIFQKGTYVAANLIVMCAITICYIIIF